MRVNFHPNRTDCLVRAIAITSDPVMAGRGDMIFSESDITVHRYVRYRTDPSAADSLLFTPYEIQHQ